MIKTTKSNMEHMNPSNIDSKNQNSNSNQDQNTLSTSSSNNINNNNINSLPPLNSSIDLNSKTLSNNTGIHSISQFQQPPMTQPKDQNMFLLNNDNKNEKSNSDLINNNKPIQNSKQNNHQHQHQHQHQFHQSNNNDDSKKDTDHIVPNAKTTTTTQSNGAITTKQNMSTPTCKNCKTQTTPLWRRDETGQVLCNACGLFLKLHGRPRPISLKSDVIKSRNRVKHNNKSSPNTPELKAKDMNNNHSSSSNNNNNNNNLSNNSNNNNNSINGITNQNNMTQNLNNNSNNNNNNNNNNNKISSKFLPKQYKPNSKNSKSKRSEKSNSKDSKNSKLLNNNNNNNNKSNKLLHNENNINGSITSPNLLSLLPRGQNNNLPPGTPYTFASTTAWMNKNQGANIQSLHYPSSTPTQFVSNLNRITSPLLLSTTTPPKLNPTPSQSQSSERSSSVNGNNNSNSNNNNNNNNNNLNRDAVLNAAGALEILSQQATSTDYIPGMRLNSPHSTPLSKPTSIVDKLPPISLLSKDTKPVSNEPIHLHNILSPPTKDIISNTSSNSLRSPSPIQSIQRHYTATDPIRTTLPPLKVLSPQLQPQSQLNISQQQHQHQHQQQQQQQQQIQYSQQLPSLKNVPGISNVMYTNNNNNSNTNNNSNSRNDDESKVNSNSDSSLLNIGNINHSHAALHEENEKLRTRISELELVNDLYKTRISELEEVDAKFQKAESDYRRQIRQLEYSLQQQSQSQNNINVKIEPGINSGEKRQSPNDENTTSGHLEKRIKVEN